MIEKKKKKNGFFFWWWGVFKEKKTTGKCFAHRKVGWTSVPDMP
jgi:hypothetical protein